MADDGLAVVELKVESRLRSAFADLTEEESRVVEEYIESQTVSGTMRALGWNTPADRKKVREMLGDPRVVRAVKAAVSEERRYDVGTAGEVKRMWTTVMRAEDTHVTSRLRASELLARAHGVIGEQAGNAQVLVVTGLPQANADAVRMLMQRFGGSVTGASGAGDAEAATTEGEP